MNYVLVFIGGGLGSVTRFFFSSAFGSVKTGFPLPTLLSNTVSCIILGVMAGLLFNKNTVAGSPRLFLFITTGFCGGFSTFSTFSLETFQLLNQGQAALALTNIALNMLICLVAITAGFYAAKLF